MIPIKILKIIFACILNLLFTPAGFYFLKDVSLFWIYVPLAILYGTIISIVAFILNSIVPGPICVSLFFLFLLSWNLLLIYFTLYSSKKEKNSEHKSFPYALWFIPVMTIFILVLRIIVTFFIGNPIANLHTLTSNGMSPNLIRDDQLFITNLFDKDKITRGDIITYRIDENDIFGKENIVRVIGLPGERVSIANSYDSNGYFARVEINRQPIIISPSKLKSIDFKSGTESVGQNIYEETLENRKYFVFESFNEFEYRYEFLNTTLKNDEYFVLGDNRDNSNDSRLIGPIRKSQITNKLLFTLLSFDIADEILPKCDPISSRSCQLGRRIDNFLFQKYRWNYLGYHNP